jgi:DNA-binding transcriptional ArsR family regulator
MAHRAMSPELMELVATRFKVLAEPVRLQILNALRESEKTVTELVEETGVRQANVSKHLQQLHATGFVERHKEGLHVYYRIADDDVFRLCEIVCGRLADESERRRSILETV